MKVFRRLAVFAVSVACVVALASRGDAARPADGQWAAGKQPQDAARSTVSVDAGAQNLSHLTLSEKQAIDTRASHLQPAPVAPSAVQNTQVLGRATSGGQAMAQQGWVEATRVEVELLPEPPQLNPVLREMIQQSCEQDLLGGPPLPVTGSPERAVPTGAPTAASGASGQTRAPGDFRFFVNQPVTPVGASTSVVAEPSVGNNDRIVFQSGNWYAAISHDDGNTWQHVDPYTSFPPVNGGFCCDQIVIYDPGRDVMVWLLQYVRDANAGTHRFAVATGVSSLENLSWCTYDFTPDRLGFGATGNWFDFPDLVLGSNHLYWTTNVYTTQTFCDGGQFDGDACSSDANCLGWPCRVRYTGTAITRLPLQEMSECVGFNFSYWNQLNIDEGERRFAFRACHGSTDPVYWAAHNTTSNIRIYRWATDSNIFWDDVDHDAFSWDDANMTCVGPDGTDSCARADTRVLGAYRAGGELGFMWISAAHGMFPYPYTRVARFQESDRALLGNAVVWSSGNAWTYPSVGVNWRGHVAGTIFANGGNIHPLCQAWINDDITASGFQPLENYNIRASTHGPASNKWGDYLAARRHSRYGYTWIGSAFTLQGGSGNANTEPRHVWFGRERDTPPPRPSNDDCADAIAIRSSTFGIVMDTQGATNQGNDPLQGCSSNGPNRNSNTVWFSYTPPCDGTIDVDTCGSQYDTVLSVFTGSCGSLTEIGCDDDAGCGTDSRSAITGLPVSRGERLYIEVSDWSLPGGGSLDFDFAFNTDWPTNDACTDATSVHVSSSVPGKTCGATVDTGAPDCTDDTGQPVPVDSPGVWYRVFGTGRTMTASTCNEGSNYDTKISVYCGSCEEGLTCIRGNDDQCTAPSDLLSSVSWCSQYGAEYLILLHGWGGEVGDFVLDISEGSVPCSGAIECGGAEIGACCDPNAGECVGGVCGAFQACGATGGCVCGLTDAGGGRCFNGFTLCGSAVPCPNGTSDCPRGQVCWVHSCCGGPICGIACTGPGAIDSGAPELEGLMAAGGGEVRAAGGDPTGRCLEITPQVCEAASGAYQGDGVSCRVTTCFEPIGACCVRGECVGVMEEPACLESGGSWFAGLDCASVNCPPPVGACCAPHSCTDGGTCADGFPACSGSFDCLCFQTADGGAACTNGSNPCGSAAPCPNGNVDCPAGEICFVESCCGEPVCAPPVCDLDANAALLDASDSETMNGAGANARGVPGGECTIVDMATCISLNGIYQGDDTVCQDDTCPGPPGACCLRGECIGTMDQRECAAAGGAWFEGEDCRTFVCPQPRQACCLPEGACVNMVPDACIERGGEPQGMGSHCEGDQNGNGRDDACEFDEVCEDCGPGSHWVDRCPAGDDTMPTGALIGIASNDNCIPDISLRLNGPVRVRRSDPVVDATSHSIQTEIVSMSLSRDGVILTAGAGLGHGGVLPPSLGRIIEQEDDTLADSFFDVFFEVDLGGGVYAYNHEALKVATKIDCLPPNARYIHPQGCIKLFDTPWIPGTPEGNVIAYLVTADHSTYPTCGDETAGDCFEPHASTACDDEACCGRVCEFMPNCCRVGWDASCAGLAARICLQPPEACCGLVDTVAGCADISPEKCYENGGMPKGPGTKCLGDASGNGIDDVCDPNDQCDICGPGRHWIHESPCPPGSDTLPSGATVGIDLTGDCEPDTSLRLHGPSTISRSGPRDFSLVHPGLRPADGHFDVIDTEIVSMTLTNPAGVVMRAGAGAGLIPLAPSFGAIAEQLGDDTLADSFFNVFFEVDVGRGLVLYNQRPLRVDSKIDCLPPDADYIHSSGCMPLFTSPLPGQGERRANLVVANHSTFLECGSEDAGDCFTPNDTPFCDDAECCAAVCEQMPFCCDVLWNDNCAGLAARVCGEPPQACCLRDGSCADLAPDVCRGGGGVPQGPHSECLSTFDICAEDGACDDCGPGDHWVDQCPAGMDHMPSGAKIGIDIGELDCQPDTSLVLRGPVFVSRSNPLDDSANFPGSAQFDDHRDVIDTEMVSLSLTGGGVVLTAGAGYGQGGALLPTLGAIVEQPGTADLADSFFHVWFEVDLGGGQYAYNHRPLRVDSKIDCLPPNATYIHPVGCIELFDLPPNSDNGVPRHIANLVTADHSTYPECGDPATGDCFELHDTPFCDDAECCRRVCEQFSGCCEVEWDEICAELAHEKCRPTQACCLPEGACDDTTPEACLDAGGEPQGENSACEGDSNGNGRDDACEFDEVCEDCGPGSHWVDRCPAGDDTMPTGALVGIASNDDCIPDISLRLNGPVRVRRSDPVVDATSHSIQTEIVSMSLSRDGVILTAGAGLGQGGVLPPSLGKIVEQEDDTLADSFFDVFFEVDLGGGVYVYNHEALTVATKIDCLPPNARYIHPQGCIKLFDTPYIPGGPSQGNVIAYLVTADHNTYPTCGDETAGDCFEPHDSTACDDEACCGAVCEIMPNCCRVEWDASCAGLAERICPQPPEACCGLPDITGGCADLPPEVCYARGGMPKGPGSMCQGDQSGNGVDDTCDPNDQCDICGPGSHWIHRSPCPPGSDTLPSGATIGIDTTGDCQPDTSLRLHGPATINRSGPRDFSLAYPGLRPADGHLDVIDTEIVSMTLTNPAGVIMKAGAGAGTFPLAPSFGAIAEQRDNDTLADSFFDVFFEVDVGGGVLLYNHRPLHVDAKIDCLPPDTDYIHSSGCIPLYTLPFPGQGEHRANLVVANHSTFLECGSEDAGDCFTPNDTPFCDDADCCMRVCEQFSGCCDVEWDGICAELAHEKCRPTQACCLPEGACDDTTPEACLDAGGEPQGENSACEGDSNGNGRDDACEFDEVCEDCGPGSHWVDRCPAGDDTMPTGALIGIASSDSCIPDISLRLNGPVRVRRSDPVVDATSHSIETEIVSMSLSRDGVILTAGAGLGQGGVLPPSLGKIVEQEDDTLADSFFDVFFEVDLGGGVYVYNHEALTVATKIDCLPPNARYIHPQGCIKLFDTPYIPGGPSQGNVIAYLVTADHNTYPTCGDETAGDCFEPHDSTACDDEACCAAVCEFMPNCCRVEWDASCAGLAERICPQPPEACCGLVDTVAGCADLPPEVCYARGGMPKGPGSECQGDQSGNGVDDVCDPSDQCEICGPGRHWIHESPCPPGIDTLPSGATIGIDTTGDCQPDTSLRLHGPATINRSGPRDFSLAYPGLRPADGHLDVIDTEIVSMTLTNPAGVIMKAGAGAGTFPLAPSFGAIAEQRDNDTLADSFFDVFFEVDVGGGALLYNHRPLHVDAKIDCLPPDTSYIHSSGCIPLYTLPFPGQGEHRANLVVANHSTFTANLVASKPEHNSSLWRSKHNIARLLFDGDIAPPAPGEVLIQELLPNGLFGPDLSQGFSLTVENDGANNPRVLRVWENDSTLQHRKWYAVRNVGDWGGVIPFELHYLLQVGDADANMIVISLDVGAVNGGIPCFVNCGDDNRLDIDGDFRVISLDVGVINGHIGSFNVPKPSGH